MTKKLGDVDRRTVDLLLDRQHDQDGNGGAFVKPGSVPPERLRSLQQILSLLQEMPAEDPPADLVGRTIRRIDPAIPMDPRAPLVSPPGAITRPPA